MIAMASSKLLSFWGNFLTNSYAAYILVQRLAYNLMTWGEWGAGFIFWLPDFGDDLAKLLFSEDLYRRLTWHDPTSFYTIGNGSFRGEIFELAGEKDKHFAYLVNEVLLPDLFRHIMVTFVMVFRGAWAGKYIGLIAFLSLPYFIWLIKKNKELLVYSCFVLPCLFFLGFHAFVSVSITRYNEPMISVYALMLATIIVYLASKIFAGKIRPIGSD